MILFKKNKIYLFIIFFIFLFIILTNCSKAKTYEVVKVFDGDTILLNNGKHIRYIGIDSPEIAHDGKKAQPFSYKAKKYNIDLVLNKKIFLKFDRQKHDRYGRMLAYVYLKDGTLVNKKLIENGYAVCLYRKPNTKYHKNFIKAQKKAMLQKKNIWGIVKNEKEKYIGNTSSMRFHKPSCKFGKKIKKKNKIILNSKYDAFWEGFAPCRRCISNFAS